MKLMDGVLKMMRSVLALLLGLALRVIIAGAQSDQSGYISIDCGLSDNSNYVDPITGIYYTSDSGFTDSGESNRISSTYMVNSLAQQFLNVRSFQEGTRNCYTLKPIQGKGSKYLIRASFMYGNYDGANQPPKFDLHLGVEYWDTITFLNASFPTTKEIIHISLSDYIHVCLVKTGPGTPFISALELRHLNITMYRTQYGSLQLFARRTFNSLSNNLIRYKDDMYDRIWTPLDLLNTTAISTNSTVTIIHNSFQLPSAVMDTACTPTNSSDSLSFYWNEVNDTDQFYIYMHFAELQELQQNQSRQLNIYINNGRWYGPYAPKYLSAGTVYSQAPTTGATRYDVVINKSANSTLPPIINALEVYTLKELPLPGTFDGDVTAMLSIKSTYELTTKNWQGDPCEPQDFVWDGVTCMKSGFNPPRIISLNLSSYGLNGLIAPSIVNLTVLQTLDLSNNNLIGSLPDFLAQMDSLKVLNLSGNDFTKPFPPQLLEKANQRRLEFRYDGASNNGNNNTTNNSGSCQSDSCKKKKNSNVVIKIVASVAAVVFFLVGLLIAFYFFRKGKRAIIKVDTALNNNQGDVAFINMQISGTSNDTGEMMTTGNNNDYIVATKSREFTYYEVLRITNNFQRVIGKGGFGTVYHGYVGNTQVAVKMLSQSSTQGYKEFQAEANLLLTINHKNLTSLIGYCYEGMNMGIIYEYMPNGNLEKHLLGKGPYVLTWEERIRISVDAAQGLEYLHHGCIPPAVHRDVKTTNILLDEKFRAKLADFGLSRAFPVDNGTHISTIVAGTPGYLDPEYYSTTRLTEKSDVYSFGVVLLEIVSGRPALPRNNEAHIITWVSSELENGDIENIIDPRLRGDYAVNSVWKLVEIAMACVARNSARRPTMNHVVMELKACLALQMARNETESKDSGGLLPMSLESRLGPQAR